MKHLFIWHWILFSCLASAAQRPNILLIVSEDNGPELSCYGQPYVQTPVLDQLAKDGIRFDRAYVPQAGCSQSRAAFLTGLYPHQNGQIGLATWRFRMYDENTPNLVRSLNSAGYRTGIIGKLHINPSAAFPFDFTAIPSANFGRKGMGQYAKKAKEFIHASEEPFFLSVNFPDAHRPFTPQVDGLPAKLLTEKDVTPLAYFGLDSPELRRQTANYLNCMSRLDSQVGDLLKVLQASGKLKNTLVVYLGDHGADMLRGKRTSYEGGVRVPLIVSWPGKIVAGQVRDELVSTLDLMPTFLEAAGAPPIEGLPGRSWSPMFGNCKVDWRQYLFTEFHTHSAHNYYPQRTVRDDRYKLIRNLMPNVVNPGYEFTRTKFFEELREVVEASSEPIRSAYERMERPPEYELYDLEADPYEFVNLAENGEYAEVLSRLKRELEKWQTDTKDPFRDPKNVKKLGAEISNSFENGQPSKAKLKLTYPDYFFSSLQKTDRKNVLFLAVDDMKDWVNCLCGYEGTVHTPNIDRLAARGTLFTNAHCPSPKCAPSRAAILTGLMPSTTGLYDNGHWWYPNLPDVVSLPSYFRKNGYHVAGAGKIFHHTAGNHPPNQWDDFQKLVFRDDPWFRGVKLNYPWSRSGPKPKGFPFSGVNGLGHENDWGSLGYKDSDYDDSRTAEYAVQFLSEAQDEPFLLACGLFRPHLPWYVPQKYFDQYPLEEVVLPKVKEDDLGDIPAAGKAFAKARRSDLTTIRKAGKYREAVQAYLASITYADAQLGRVLNALDRSNQAENTIVVLWSDHGWHLGEKNHWHKTTLWEEATRVPFIISAPGFTASRCSKPVSLIDLYPTLLELCGFPLIKRHDGVSLVPLLDDPDTPWERPAIVQFKPGNVAVRSERYRYIRYQDGGEEFYDLRTDPQEWTNQAKDPQFASQKKELSEWATKNWAPSAPTKGAFYFNPDSFTWKEKSTGRLINGATNTQPQNP